MDDKEKDEVIKTLTDLCQLALTDMIPDCDFYEKIIPELVLDSSLLSHSKKVAYYSMVIFYSIREKYGFTEMDKKKLFMSSLLHDIGKLKISPEILNKPVDLTQEEWNEVKKHPLKTLAILENYEFIKGLFPIILHHHERYDGRGYPVGLSGENIPVLCRIITIADCFDAMTSKRPYKQPYPIEYAMGEILENAGTQFDPYIADCFITLCKKRKLNVGWEF